MFLKKLELVLSKVKLHKKINEIIFHTVFGVYESDNLLKSPNTFTFCITHPEDKWIYLLVANFPQEDGFVQTQAIDERLPVKANLKIIQNFEEIIYEIDSFLNSKLNFNFNISIDSDSEDDHNSVKIKNNSENILTDDNYFETYNLSQKNTHILSDRFHSLETII